jgi:riboflavin biosynthesis pyrimidine reductase
VFRLLRRECDALLVGAGTFRAENYRPLTLDTERRAWRIDHGLAPYPRLVVASRSLRLPATHPHWPTHRATDRLDCEHGTRRRARSVADIVRAAGLTIGLQRLRAMG